MEVLTVELAESIVRRTTKVIHNKINIMNERGIIIASSDKNRIGTIHKGALIALQRKSEFNADGKQSENLNGVYPEINLTIEFQNKIVGVIGITGNPKEVLSYGKLIKMTAQMMIEQAYVINEIKWTNRIKEEIMLALIYNKQESFSLIEEYAKKFKIPNNHPMIIFIVELSFEDISKNNNLDTMNRIINLLEGTFKESLAVIINSRTVVLLHKCLCNNSKVLDYQEKIEAVSDKICKQLEKNVKISIGKRYDKLFDTYKSFQTAEETLAFGKKIHPNTNVYFFDLLKCHMLFYQNNSMWKIKELEDTYKLISSNDKNGELRETLKVLIGENGELNNVSNKLSIHRNTLSYRLNKIYKLTGRNPKNYIDLFSLYSAMVNFYMS